MFAMNDRTSSSTQGWWLVFAITLAWWIAFSDGCFGLDEASEKTVLESLRSDWERKADLSFCYQMKLRMNLIEYAAAKNKMTDDAGFADRVQRRTQDRVSEMTADLIVRGSSVRFACRYDAQSHDDHVPKEDITVVRDGRSTNYHRKLSPTGQFPQAVVKKETDITSNPLQGMTLYPIVFSLSPIGRNLLIDQHFSEAKYLGVKRLLGRDCSEVFIQSNHFYFDRARGGVLQRISSDPGEMTFDITVNEWQEVNDSWFPKVWIYTLTYAGQTVSVSTFHLEQVELKDDCSPGIFDIDLPDGTLVTDSTSGQDISYLKRRSGSRVAWLIALGTLATVILIVVLRYQNRLRRIRLAGRG